MLRNKSYKFRIYPDDQQKNLLNKVFGCIRFVWNHKVSVWNSNGELSYRSITELREEFPWLKEVSYVALQQKERDFDKYKKQKYNKKRKIQLGNPRFKKKGFSESFRLTGRDSYIKDSVIHIQKIGKMPVIMDREIPKEAKKISVTISKTSTGKYFASFLYLQEILNTSKTHFNVGIDLGLKVFAVQSDGHFIQNPKFFRENQSKLAKAQRHLSRKKKGSSRYNKQKIKVARIHEKIKNSRKDFLQKYSTYLVDNYDVIVLEDLNISGMMKNRRLSKAIGDAGWRIFVEMLKYKCSWYGKQFIQINRFTPTSKKCHCCGWMNKKMNLGTLEFICEECGIIEDRDLNAAKNILVSGLSIDG